jgi:uncharacterized protein YbjQ (UPF0145 family)
VNQVELYQQSPLTNRQQQPSSAFNNDMAFAVSAGDPRYQMKRLDRAGFSRGGAQAAQAGIAGARDMAGGIAEAYQNEMARAHSGAMADLEWRGAQEQYAQALGGLQQQNAYANQMAQLQRQQALLRLLD